MTSKEIHTLVNIAIFVYFNACCLLAGQADLLVSEKTGVVLLRLLGHLAK